MASFRYYLLFLGLILLTACGANRQYSRWIPGKSTYGQKTNSHFVRQSSQPLAPEPEVRTNKAVAEVPARTKRFVPNELLHPSLPEMKPEMKNIRALHPPVSDLHKASRQVQKTSDIGRKPKANSEKKNSATVATLIVTLLLIMVLIIVMRGAGASAGRIAGVVVLGIVLGILFGIGLYYLFKEYL